MVAVRQINSNVIYYDLSQDNYGQRVFTVESPWQQKTEVDKMQSKMQ